MSHPKRDLREGSFDVLYFLSSIAPFESDLKTIDPARTDWDLISSLALENRVHTFFINIKRYGFQGYVPISTWKRFEACQDEALQSGLFWNQRFHAIAAQFIDRGVRFFPMKGISLLMDTYPDERYRTLRDLDLFIHGADFQLCREILQGMGYQPDTLIRNGVRLERGRECTFKGPQKDEIDVHYRFFQWHIEKYVYQIDSRKFLDHTELKEWHGLSIPRLKKEYEFYYLLMCAFSETVRPIRVYIDLDALIRVHGEGMDWDGIQSLVTQSAIAPKLCRILAVLRDKMKSPLPGKWVGRNSSRDESVWCGGSAGQGMKLFYLNAAPNLAGKAGLIVSHIYWQLFLAFGIFGWYFKKHNNPAGQ